MHIGLAPTSHRETTRLSWHGSLVELTHYLFFMYADIISQSSVAAGCVVIIADLVYLQSAQSSCC